MTAGFDTATPNMARVYDYGGGTWPAHQLAEFRLTPSLALAQGTDVHAGDGGLPFGDLIYAAAAPPRHAPVFFASIAKIAFPPSSGCQPQ